MLSDDSSSDSETGRFKSNARAERHNFKQYSSSQCPRGAELLPDLSRNKNNERSFRRESDRRNEGRGRFNRRRSHSRDRFESSRRHSPPRRRYSRDRSPDRPRLSKQNTEHSRSRDVREKCIRKLDDTGHERYSKKKSVSPKSSQDSKRNFKEEIRKNIVVNIFKDKNQERTKSEENVRSSRDKNREHSKSSLKDSSPDFNMDNTHKKSEIIVPKKRIHKEKSKSAEKEINRSKSRRYSEKEEDISDIEQPASYYNLTPAIEEVTVVDETIHSVTDSSEDEEKLRAKLLNLEKQLDKSKKKKFKKSKKKSKSKHKDKDDPVVVSSTTDIQEKELDLKNIGENPTEIVEVSSTEVRVRKDSSEEGEICSEDDGANVSIDPTDLRHRLKRSTAVADTSGSPDLRDKLKQKVDVAGPALPPHMRKDDGSPTPEIEGPKLPPHLQKNRNIGPVIPSEMRKVLAEASQDQTEVHHTSSEDEGIGPLPQGAEEKWTVAHKKLEERALHMKIRDLEGGSSKSDAKVREEWMLELPEAKAKHIGLGPRQFRSKAGPDMSDRSSWTDTPQEKALKAVGLAPEPEASTTALQQQAHDRYIAERDHDQEKAVKKHKKKHKRDESLLEMHEKKIKKKKKKEEKEEGGSKRRPFDRNIDMQVNRFDEAQKRSIIKKAQQLDTRFSSGQAKFL